MKSLKHYYFKWKVDRDKSFLEKKGIEKAKENKLELNIGGELLKLDKPKDKLEIPYFGNGVDTRELIALVADDYPKITKRYISNKIILESYLISLSKTRLSSC